MTKPFSFIEDNLDCSVKNRANTPTEDVTIKVDGTDTYEAVFSEIYKKNLWRDSESVSGRGSSLKATEQLRIDLEAFFAEKSIRAIVDIPCGDFNWFRAIEFKFDRYVGYDIVKDLIDTNTLKYGSSSTRFCHANILYEDIENADIVLCRDFVIHSSNNDIFAFFANLRRSGIPKILLSQYGNCQNKDIDTGNRYRPIDFTQAPFFFPSPKELIGEDIDHMFDTASRHVCDSKQPLRKFLGYWEMADIYQALDQNYEYQAFLKGRPTDMFKKYIIGEIQND